MSEVLVPEGYKAIYFHIGRDSFDSELTLVQVDANDHQIQTEIEWDEGSKVRRGVLFYPDNADPEERLVLKLDVKPEQAQLVHYAPDTDRANKNALVLTDDGFGRIHVESHQIVPRDRPSWSIPGVSAEVPAKDRPIRSTFDEAFTEAMKESIWDRLAVK